MRVQISQQKLRSPAQARVNIFETEDFAHMASAAKQHNMEEQVGQPSVVAPARPIHIRAGENTGGRYRF